jgi:hypothetical protein
MTKRPRVCRSRIDSPRRRTPLSTDESLGRFVSGRRERLRAAIDRQPGPSARIPLCPDATRYVPRSIIARGREHPSRVVWNGRADHRGPPGRPARGAPAARPRRAPGCRKRAGAGCAVCMSVWTARAREHGRRWSGGPAERWRPCGARRRSARTRARPSRWASQPHTSQDLSMTTNLRRRFASCQGSTGFQDCHGTDAQRPRCPDSPLLLTHGVHRYTPPLPVSADTARAHEAVCCPRPVARTVRLRSERAVTRRSRTRPVIFA